MDVYILHINLKIYSVAEKPNLVEIPKKQKLVQQSYKKPEFYLAGLPYKQPVWFFCHFLQLIIKHIKKLKTRYTKYKDGDFSSN